MKYQKFNKRNNAYVKYKKEKNGKCKIIDVKQKEPKKPFKGIQIKQSNR